MKANGASYFFFLFIAQTRLIQIDVTKAQSGLKIGDFWSKDLVYAIVKQNRSNGWMNPRAQPLTRSIGSHGSMPSDGGQLSIWRLFPALSRRSLRQNKCPAVCGLGQSHTQTLLHLCDCLMSCRTFMQDLQFVWETQHLSSLRQTVICPVLLSLN